MPPREDDKALLLGSLGDVQSLASFLSHRE